MKIAILRRNGLGDLLLAYPLVYYAKELFPDAHITLFVDQRNYPLTRYLAGADEIVVFPDRGNKYLTHYQIARRYRGVFDLAISAKTSPMKLVNLFLYWLKAPQRIAYVDTSWHSCLINHPIPFNPLEAEKTHQALKGLRTLAPDLQEIPERLVPKIVMPSDLQYLKLSFDLPKPIVLVSATTTSPLSRLSSERYTRILNRLHTICPSNVLILGQYKDQERAHAIANGLIAPHVIHFPRHFDDFMLSVKASDLIFVGDGGIAHIGAALKKQEVVVFGGVRPENWRPLNRQAKVFHHPVHVDHLSEDILFEALLHARNHL